MPRRKLAMKDVSSCDKLRGAAKRALIRRFPNGATFLSIGKESSAEYIGGEKQTQGTETSQYLEEKTSIEILLVVASERGTA